MSKPTSAESSKQPQPLVLIVDDFQDSSDMYGIYLSLSGFRVLKAIDGSEAIRLAHDAAPDVILMDLHLPGLDGYETTRRLKQSQVTRTIPVIALTAHALDQPESMRSFGFEATIMKPCLPEALTAQVRRIVHRV